MAEHDRQWRQYQSPGAPGRSGRSGNGVSAARMCTETLHMVSLGWLERLGCRVGQRGSPEVKPG